MLKRVVRITLLTVLLVGALHPMVTAEEVTIRIAHWLGDPIHGSGLEWLMNEVEKEVAKHGIRVETVINGTDGYADKVISQTMAGIGPDVIFGLPYTHFGIQQLLRDLTPYLQADPELNFDSFMPVVWDIFTYHGETKLLPVGVSPYLLFYNRQHFAQAGLPEPDASWTWLEDVPDALLKLHQVGDDGTVLRYGLVLENRLWSLFLSAGGEVLDETGTRSTLVNPNVADLLEEVHRWRRENLIPNHANHRPTFASGRGSMHAYMGTFAFPYYVEHAANIDWSFSLPPRGPAGIAIDENVNGWGISLYSQHPDEAWIVLKALANVTGDITMAALGHFSPVIGKTDSATIAYLEDEIGLTQREIETALEAINYVRPRFRHAKADEITPIVESTLSQIVWGGRPAIPMLTNASERIDAILRSNP